MARPLDAFANNPITSAHTQEESSNRIELLLQSKNLGMRWVSAPKDFLLKLRMILWLIATNEMELFPSKNPKKHYCKASFYNE